MNATFRLCQVAVGVTLAVSSVTVFAQSSGASSRSGSQTDSMPWEGRYWSYGGISIGRSDYDFGCPPGFGCDRHATAFKAFGGGRFNEFLGLEASYVYLGKGERGGGDTKGQGVNLSLVGSIPLGQTVSVNGKVGGIYGWTKTDGIAPGMATGKDHGLGLSYGAGVAVALTRTVDLRLDWDRYRMKFETGRDDVDLISVGAAFKF